MVNRMSPYDAIIILSICYTVLSLAANLQLGRPLLIPFYNAVFCLLQDRLAYCDKVPWPVIVLAIILLSFAHSVESDRVTQLYGGDRRSLK